MELKDIWAKANTLRGFLADKRTVSSRRRHETSEEVLEVKNQFVDDELRLSSGKYFRRLKEITQVFPFPRTFVRNRQDHIREVAGYAAVIAEMLGLNVDLARVAALGHDMGHVPFGHQGEEWLQKAMGKPDFCHEVMFPVIAQHVERRGHGLNLAWHTLDAGMRHSTRLVTSRMSQEAHVVRHADKIGYLFADISDIVERERRILPPEIIALANEFGTTQRERVFTAIASLIIESYELGSVSFEHLEYGQKFQRLRELMLPIYSGIFHPNLDEIMTPVLEYLIELDVPNSFLLLALMTDQDVVDLASLSSISREDFSKTSISEIMPYVWEIGDVDMCDPDLGWWDEAAGPVHVYRIKDGEEEYWWIATTPQEAEEMHRANPQISGNLKPEEEIEVWQEPDNERCGVIERFVEDQKVHQIIYSSRLEINDDFLEEKNNCIIKSYGEWAREKGRGFFNSTV